PTATPEIVALPPDAVVVDIACAEGTALHVLKGIGEIPENDRPACVVLTNFSREWYQDAAKLLGADYFFDKSRQIPDMLDVLRSMIPSRRPTPAGQHRKTVTLAPAGQVGGTEPQRGLRERAHDLIAEWSDV